MATKSQALIAKGIQAGKQRNWEEALDFLLQSLRADPKNSEALFLVGAAYHQMGRRDRAAQYIRRSLEINPNQQAAQAFLDRLTVPSVGSAAPETTPQEKPGRASRKGQTDTPVLLGAFAGEVEEPGVGALFPLCLIAAGACSLLLFWYVVLR